MIDWTKCRIFYCVTCKGTADLWMPLTDPNDPLAAQPDYPGGPGTEVLVLCPGQITNKARRISENKVEHL